MADMTLISMMSVTFLRTVDGRSVPDDIGGWMCSMSMTPFKSVKSIAS
jgi:hypothetical protein